LAGGAVLSSAGIAPRNHPKQVRARRSRLAYRLGENGQLTLGPEDPRIAAGLSGALDGVDDRRTPRDLFDPLNKQYGFTLDAAASADNALLPRFYTREDDGLTKPWRGEMVWCNPPFSNIPAWVEKASIEVMMGCLGVVMLLPADRTEQAWWQDKIEHVRDCGAGVTVKFIRKRVKFGLPPDHPDANKGLAGGRGGRYRYPPFGCVLVHFEGDTPGVPWVDPRQTKLFVSDV
jgi:phage N-6-adenine-methyltransferase